MTVQLAMDKLLIQRKQIEEKEPGFGKKCSYGSQIP